MRNVPLRSRERRCVPRWLLHRLDALGNHAAVEFDLRFAGATAGADATALALQVAPAAHQTGRQVLQARQFHLQLALVALRARSEDLEDQHRAVGNGHAEVALQVALLGRRERLVEQHGLGLVPFNERLDFVGLARPDEERRIGRLALGNDPRNRRIAGRFGEQRQFVEGVVEVCAAAEVHTHQDGPG
jgi:hypothetical protein